MARDALEPGPENNYPAWPRNPDGSPELGPGTRMPTGTCQQRDSRGKLVLIDVTPRKRDGTPIVPPTIPPGGEG